jgi:NaMN:DMB phosphoribosyltransferase
MEMFDGLKIYGSGNYLEGVTDRDSLFICAVATTETSKIQQLMLNS